LDNPKHKDKTDVLRLTEPRSSANPNGIGVFWQTQGSGKSFSMVFFAQKVLRKVAGNWTFVIVTYRVELDDQIAKTFKATGAVSEGEGDQCHAASGAHLRELLRGNHRYVFTLIHKFRPENLLPLPAKNERGEDRGEGLPHKDSPLSDSLPARASRGERENNVMPVLCDRPDVIVLTDEAHRSQYYTLAPAWVGPASGSGAPGRQAATFSGSRAERTRRGSRPCFSPH
jgi:type I restriction enzyme R subunit